MVYYIVTVKMHPYTQKRGESLYQNVTSGSILMGNLYFLFFLFFFFGSYGIIATGLCMYLSVKSKN